MEHIVQFAIGIDDAAIQKRIEENGYNDVLNKLVEKAKDDLPKTSSFSGKHVNWRYLVDERLDSFIELHKDEIIDLAAEKLCESFKRTKAYKDHMIESMERENVND